MEPAGRQRDEATVQHSLVCQSWAATCHMFLHVCLRQVGERAWVGVHNGTCPEDCLVPYALCPAVGGRPCGGKGRCLSNLGLCTCFQG